MRLIDADVLMKGCYEELEDNSLWHDEDTSKDYADGHDEGKRIIMAIIDQAPIIDIVQCKECKHWERLNYEAPKEGWCNTPMIYCDGKWTDADDYCSYGERENE